MRKLYRRALAGDTAETEVAKSEMLARRENMRLASYLPVNVTESLCDSKSAEAGLTKAGSMFAPTVKFG